MCKFAQRAVKPAASSRRNLTASPGREEDMTDFAKGVSRIVVKGTPSAPHQGVRRGRQDVARVRRGFSALRGGVEDERIASRFSAMLLITASTPGEVESLARRIHAFSSRAAAPFLSVRAGAFPIEPWALREKCSAWLDAAICGSLLMTDVEEMPVLVQEVFLELLTELQSVRAGSATVRLIAGTTMSLLDRVAAGMFSERLFSRLNVIHLVVKPDPASASIQR
jgi:transcriptional regulator of acetoin/glycerol metabolism